jgi:hypothetical protein
MPNARTPLKFALAAVTSTAVLLGTVRAGTVEESELIALGRAWIDAEVHHDKAALERLLDERFLVTYSSGRTIDRAAFIEQIMAAEIKPFEVLNEVVHIHGDTAVVIDTTTDHKTKFTWIAVKREGKWRVISETFSKIAEEKKQ